MPTIKVAHVKQQGVDLVIVPLDDEFGRKPERDRHAAIAELQTRSVSAGLKGTVVPVWDDGGGRMAFIAPQPWHPFFKSINLGSVWANVNRELSW